MGAGRFRDRREAGRVLAARLGRYAGRENVLVLGLPRGGVPVAWEVARALRAPLDALVVRKLGVPGQEELALGAIAGGGTRVVNEDVAAALGLGDEAVARVAATESRELERRELLYRGARAPVDVAGRTVVLVDDGLATGATMRAAVLAVRAGGAARVVVAVPVAAPDTRDALSAEVDEVVCALAPERFVAVGHWYADFTPTSDEEVRRLLAEPPPAAAGTRR
jgi:predicted phosphoribosyltransferase